MPKPKLYIGCSLTQAPKEFIQEAEEPFWRYEYIPASEYKALRFFLKDDNSMSHYWMEFERKNLDTQKIEIVTMEWDDLYPEEVKFSEEIIKIIDKFNKINAIYNSNINPNF